MSAANRQLPAACATLLARACTIMVIVITCAIVDCRSYRYCDYLLISSLRFMITCVCVYVYLCLSTYIYIYILYIYIYI